MTLIWFLGGRIHFEKIADCIPQRWNYWKVQLKDGEVLSGKLKHRSADAATLETSAGASTFVRSQIVRMEPLTEKEFRAAVSKGEITVKSGDPLLTFRKEDNLLYPLFSGASFISNRHQAAGGLTEMAAKMTGLPQSKVQKFLRENKIDPNHLSFQDIQKYQSRLQNLKPEEMQKYQKYAEKMQARQ